MEKIKKALEQAKKERDANLGQPVETTKQAPTAHIAREDQITYTQTQKFTASPDVLSNNRIIIGSENSEIVAAYKMLRTQLLQKLNDNQWNALAMTSPSAGAGCSLTSINLAISLAMEVRHTVLLVDFNLRSPGLHKLFGFQPKFGLSDYLLHDTPLEEILVNPGYEGVVMLPGSQPLLNSSETLSSPKLVQLVEELKNRYPSRIVLFDLPPILTSDDALAFSPYTDAFLLVLEEGKTKKAELENSMHLLKDVEVIGTVINKSKEIKAG
ncbi:MAG: exopolysaccharide biosynthesis protein [Gammaproteobacteria bacterium]|nr:MAG: exopolysaccharide biosynthesis protein [Gammaproteobacteria bacterium]